MRLDKIWIWIKMLTRCCSIFCHVCYTTCLSLFHSFSDGKRIRVVSGYNNRLFLFSIISNLWLKFGLTIRPDFLAAVRKSMPSCLWTQVFCVMVIFKMVESVYGRAVICVYLSKNCNFWIITCSILVFGKFHWRWFFECYDVFKKWRMMVPNIL